MQEVGDAAALLPVESEHVLELGGALDDVPLEIRAPIAEVGDVLHVAQPLLAAAQAIQGRIERARDVADLVRALGSQPDLEIAAAHLLGGPLDLADRAQEVAGCQGTDAQRHREGDEPRERTVTAGLGERRELGEERGRDAQLERGESVRDLGQRIRSG